MKANYKRGLIMAVALMLGGILQAGAQEYKTDVSIREQLVNGSVPGAQYGPKKIQPLRQAVVLNKSAHKQSLGEQIKNGTEGGLQAAPGGGGHKFKAKVQAAKIGGSNGQMASEVKQDVKKEPIAAIVQPTQGKEPVIEKIAVEKAPVPPMQGEKTSPATKEPIKNNN